MSRWLINFEAPHPTDKAKCWTVGLSEDKIKFLRSKGHEVKLARASLAGEVVEQPLLIAKGWLRFETEECFVYIGKPAVDRRSRTIEVPPLPESFFLAFVLPDGTIADWAWRQASNEDPTVPSDIGEIIWPPT